MITLSLRTLVCNAAAVFSGGYGAVTRPADVVGCSRQTVYEHARPIEQRLEPMAPGPSPAEGPTPAPAPAAVVLDEPTRRRRAVTAFARGLSTRPIEDLIRVIQPADGPDHATVARGVADEAQKAKEALDARDAACVPKVRARAVDAIFLGGDRPWSASSRPA